MNERQEHLLVWLFECRGLTAWEVDELGEPGDADELDGLARMGLVRRDHAAWWPGVVS